MNFKAMICLVFGLLATVPAQNNAMQQSTAMQQKRTTRWGKYALWTAGVTAIATAALGCWKVRQKYKRDMFIARGHASVYYRPAENAYEVVLARPHWDQPSRAAQAALQAIAPAPVAGNSQPLVDCIVDHRLMPQNELVPNHLTIYINGPLSTYLHNYVIAPDPAKQKVLELTNEDYDTLVASLGSWWTTQDNSEEERLAATQRQTAWSSALAQRAHQQRMAHAAAAAPAANA